MPATAITNVRTLHHINILVDDLDAGVAFYHGMVGLALDDTPDHDFPSQFFKFADGAQITHRYQRVIRDLSVGIQ